MNYLQIRRNLLISIRQGWTASSLQPQERFLSHHPCHRITKNPASVYNPSIWVNAKSNSNSKILKNERHNNSDQPLLPLLSNNPEPCQDLQLCQGGQYYLASLPRFWERNPRHGVTSRWYTTSSIRYADREPSSKVEQTVNALKEEVEQQQQKPTTSTATGQDLFTGKVKISQTVPDDQKATAGAVATPVKRSLAKRVWDEIVHYYHGFRLLFIDIRIASRLAYKSLNGEDLSRREYRQLTRTTADIFRLVPFSIFVIVPFMELLLPVFLKFFPGMLPSTFQSAKDKESKIKQQLKVKLDMTKFLQTTLDEMALQSKKGEHHSHAAKEFAEFFSKIRQSGELVSNESILKFSKLFQDEITLDSLSRPQLVALCRLLELKPMGPDNLLRFQLRMQLKSLKSDDRMIQKEGVSSLTIPELQQACRARGMRALGVDEERLKTQMSQWLELSLNEKIPPSLLLLTRVLYLPENLPATDQLKATIQSLPLEAATEARYKIGETEGKIDNRTRLEVIKQEEAAIRKEQEDAKKEEEKEAIPATSETIVDGSKVSVDAVSEVASTTGSQKKELRKEDIESLEQALEQVGLEKKSLAVEKEELEDLKEEMADYKEDIEEFKEMQKLTGRRELTESRAAKALRKRVDKMINKMDNVMNRLESKKEQIQELIDTLSEADDIQRQKDNLVNINELLTSIRSLQTVEDESKLKTIIDVLDSMDMDHDGKVDVEHVVKVIEVLEREDITLSSDQMKEVVKQLIREEEEEKEVREKDKKTAIKSDKQPSQ